MNFDDYKRKHPKSNVRCDIVQGTSGKKNLERRKSGVCEMFCKACDGSLTTCELCRRLLCEYHLSKHLSSGKGYLAGGRVHYVD